MDKIMRNNATTWDKTPKRNNDSGSKTLQAGKEEGGKIQMQGAANVTQFLEYRDKDKG